jgi:hypothetical protein
MVQGTKLPSQSRAFRVLPDREHDYLVGRIVAAQDSPVTSLALADVYAYIDENGRQTQRTEFYLPPLADRELIVQWPQGQEPIAAFLEDRLLTPLPLDGHRWRLPLGPTDLPLALTTVCKSEESGTVALNRPRLWNNETEYPLQLTLWNVAAPASLRNAGQGEVSDATRGEMALLRLARLTQLVATAESRLASLSEQDRTAWTRLWSGRLRSESVKLEESKPPAETQPNQSTVGEEDRTTRDQLITQLNQLLTAVWSCPVLSLTMERDVHISSSAALRRT